jgi:transcriptional regulator with XRE-family HTH domain
MERMRTGSDEEGEGPQLAPRREEPQRAPRVARKEPGRRVREREAREERAAEVRQAQERPTRARRAPSPTAEAAPEAAPQRERRAPPEGTRARPGTPEGAATRRGAPAPEGAAAEEGAPGREAAARPRARRRETAVPEAPGPIGAGAMESAGAAEPPGPPAGVAAPEEETVPTPEEGVVERLAGRLAAMRAARDWSLQDLARYSAVSKSTLSRIERGQISPTAEVLIKLAGAYDRTLSGLLAEVEAQPRSLVRSAEQTVTGEDAWRRRAVSPPFPGLRGSVVDAQLQPATDVLYEPPVAGAEQHLWLITGVLEVTLGTSKAERTSHADVGENEGESGDFVLVRGDCLRLRLWGPTHLRCLSPDPARYALLTVAP